MTLPTDIDALSLIAKLVAVAGLFTTGVVLLVQAYLKRRPSRSMAPHRTIASRPSRRSPVTIVASAPRLGPGSELKRLASVLDGARVRLDTITTSQRAAARHLDSAEMSLNRLLSEIADIMPAAIAPTIVPRRGVAVDSAAKTALAA